MIRRYGRTTRRCFLKTHFRRLLREIVINGMVGRDMRWQRAAVDALQDASEAYLVTFFSQVNLATVHAKRITIRKEDCEIIKKVCD